MKYDKASLLIKIAAIEFDKIANPVFEKYDLSGAQYKVLKYLYDISPEAARVVDIEKEYSMTHPTAIGLVSQLEKKGFVTRVDNPNDARGKLIMLTDKALMEREELQELSERVERELTGNITAAEKKELIRILQKLVGDGGV